ncbi:MULTISPECIES: ESX secretion-associated protein EspG [unclassified Nocardia]|uniref:ESX secretion-associated protein EspG n=1 Tax=unclassified Nocardia TaxID=2637762 RepID=UPI001CE4377D|nr:MULTISPECIES: ESX secretion-associated protein EspG [unclassified Nocardia]
MNVTRTFTDLEFATLWRRYADAPLPYPLIYVSRIAVLSDYEAALAQTWERLRGTVEGETVGAIETLGNPDVFVSVRGWCDHDMNNPTKRIRICAVRSGVRGYLITQLPGESIWYSGGYTIAECDPNGLAAAVVAALPEVEAGRRGNIPVYAAASSDEYRALIYENEIVEGMRRSREFLGAPATLIGEIIIRQGRSMYGPRGIIERLLRWRDLPGDGRYVIGADDPPVAIGTGARRLTGLIGDAIDMMMHRVESHWESEEPSGGWTNRMRGSTW